MNDTDTKIFTMFYINEHDLLPEKKLALMEWVKDASMDQVKFLLLTGEVKDQLVKEDLDYLKEGYYDSALSFMDEPKPKGDKVPGGMAGGVAAGVVVAAVGIAAYKGYKRFFSQAARACKDHSGVKKTNCMNDYKRKAQRGKIAILQKGITKCSKTKDQEKCKKSIQNKISKEKAKMGQL